MLVRADGVLQITPVSIHRVKEGHTDVLYCGDDMI